MSVTEDTGLARRFQQVPPFAYCRVPGCDGLMNIGGNAPGLHTAAQRHTKQTGHPTAVQASTVVIWERTGGES